MDFLDVVIIVVAVSAWVGGYRLGFLARVASWVGMGVGLYFGARLLPDVIGRFRDTDPYGRLLVASMVLLGGAFIGQALGLVTGTRLHFAIPVGRLRLVDRGAGAAIGVLGVAVAVWALLPAMANVNGWSARETRNSAIARFVDHHFPRPPNTLQALRRLVGDYGFPEVFRALGPAQNVGPAPTRSALSAALTARVAASTVRVQGEACHRIQEGSGWAVGSGMIVTNAHVVAGERRTAVLVPSSDGGRTLPATVVAFDPDRDLALLRVGGLGRAPLPLADGSVGTQGAVFGHPGGQSEVAVSPAVVRQEVEAEGRDLYDTHDTRRDVFVLAAHLAPGDSGGPLVDTSGTVVGVAFAIAPDRPGTSYALASAEVRAFLPSASSGAVGTGPCLND